MNQSEINTSIPAYITAFNPENQTATVSIAVKAKHHANVVEYPALPDVPVIFPSVNGYAITFPIKVFPTPCILQFQQRSLSKWWNDGGIVDPVDNRTHSLSDAVAILGLRNSQNTISGFNNDVMELRSEDGKTRIAIDGDNGKFSINNDSESLLVILSEVLELLGGEQAVVAGGSSTGIWDIKNQGAYQVLKSRLDKLKM